VHSDVGNRCVACQINFESMPLRTELRNGDRVEIVTAPHARPNPAWLGYVRTGRARAEIRRFLKTQHNEESAILGERLLGQALRGVGVDPAMIAALDWERFLKSSGGKSKSEVLTDIGLGKRLPAIIARQLLEGSTAGAGASDESRRGAILIRGTEGVAVQLAACCRPIPGDPIVGVIRKGQGLVVHTHDCPVIAKQRGDWVDVDWEPGITRAFEVVIRVFAANQRGVLAKLAAAIAEEQSNIVNVSMDQESGATTTLNFTLQVGDRQHLARILRNLRRVPEVVRIMRCKEKPKD
jgi:guanosine-3',5'-bis(diphosphate) 3'-pyrophosphohydrolase